MDSNVKLVKTLLKYTFGLVPIIAGLDKLTNLLTEWNQYISTALSDIMPFKEGGLCNHRGGNRNRCGRIDLFKASDRGIGGNVMVDRHRADIGFL
ncbi:hypothetical protein MNBD_BACTEROID03-1661 [hydrothermal vent metagenome]|uniref:Uncharacterized protein n=1 Tax=hydrothermal vent metagenome TaxID=652676 RepID=A0A3B0TS16_9ZZZZ